MTFPQNITLNFLDIRDCFSFIFTNCLRWAKTVSIRVFHWDNSKSGKSSYVYIFQDRQTQWSKLRCETKICYIHCLKSVQIQRFFSSIFSYIWTEYGDLLPKYPYSVWIQENRDQKKLCIWTRSRSDWYLFLFKTSWRGIAMKPKILNRFM